MDVHILSIILVNYIHDAPELALLMLINESKGNMYMLIYTNIQLTCKEHYNW